MQSEALKRRVMWTIVLLGSCLRIVLLILSGPDARDFMFSIVDFVSWNVIGLFKMLELSSLFRSIVL